MNVSAQNWEAIKDRAAGWLLDGISPQRLAWTLALGFVLGCIPLVGIPTGLCAVIAMTFRLNLAAIQAANYAAMPFQLALMVPFIRLGGKLTPAAHSSLDLAMLAHSPLQLITHSSTELVSQVGVLAGQALLGWLLLAIPFVALLTFALTRVLRRLPAIASIRLATKPQD
jgi:Uncharacterized protein conserved in bacteria (DUF2062)